MTHVLLLLALVGSHPPFDDVASSRKPFEGTRLELHNVELTPPTPAIECVPGMTVFEPDPVPLPLDTVIEYTDELKRRRTWVLRQGILVSECGFIEILNIKAEHGRMKTELKSLNELMKVQESLWASAEEQYQRRISELEEATAPSLWDEWKGPNVRRRGGHRHLGGLGSGRGPEGRIALSRHGPGSP